MAAGNKKKWFEGSLLISIITTTATIQWIVTTIANLSESFYFTGKTVGSMEGAVSCLKDYSITDCEHKSGYVYSVGIDRGTV